MTQAAPQPDRWLDADAAAKHLSIRLDGFRRKVADGTIPRPSYALGERTPRWRTSWLDAVMDPGTASTDPRTAVDALAAKIEAQGRQGRQAQAR